MTFPSGAPTALTRTPASAFPEMTLRSPAFGPPTVLLLPSSDDALASSSCDAGPVGAGADVVADDLVAVRLDTNAGMPGVVEVADREPADRRAAGARRKHQPVGVARRRRRSGVTPIVPAGAPGSVVPSIATGTVIAGSGEPSTEICCASAAGERERDPGDARRGCGVGGVDRLAQRAVGGVAGAVVVVGRRVDDVGLRRLQAPPRRSPRCRRGMWRLQLSSRLDPVDVQRLVRRGGGVRDRVDGRPQVGGLRQHVDELRRRAVGQGRGERAVGSVRGDVDAQRAGARVGGDVEAEAVVERAQVLACSPSCCRPPATCDAFIGAVPFAQPK